MKKLLVIALVAFAPSAYAADVALSPAQVSAVKLGTLVKSDIGSFTNDVKLEGLGTATNVGVTLLGVGANMQITGAVNMIVAGPTLPGQILH